MEFLLKKAIQIAIIDFVIIFGIIVYLNFFPTKPAEVQNSTKKISQPSNIPEKTEIPTNSIIQPTTSAIINSNTPTLSVDQPTSTPQPAPTAADLFQQVAQHNSQNDCWMIIAGHIYNITSFFGSHPGGDAVMLKYCGQDATTAFNTKDKNPGAAHSGAAASMLQSYLIQ